MIGDIKLPPLPADSETPASSQWEWSSQDMRDYALAAIEADRQQRRGEPVAWMTSDKRHIAFGDRLTKEEATQYGWTPLYTAHQPAEPVNKTDWNAELSSWSDEDFIQVFHERPDLADRLRKMLAEPVKRKRRYAQGTALREDVERMRAALKRISAMDSMSYHTLDSAKITAKAALDQRK